MEKIILQKLEISNFKGHVRTIVNFNEKETLILGPNEAGKTSIFDAFIWLLFGKDSQDRKDFSIKPLDAQGKTSVKTETEVIGTFLHNGNILNLRRVLVEKWTKRRGSNDLEFTGNETKFYWNDVPFSLAEYNSAIKNIIDEELFKLLTNPEKFNSLHWQERRKILFSIVGIGTDADLATIIQETNPQIADFVISILNQQKTLKQYKDEVAEKKKKIKDELEQIPSRIDEISRQKPVFEFSKEKISEAIEELKEYEAKSLELIQSEQARKEQSEKEIADKRSSIQKQIREKETQIQDLTHKLTLEANKEFQEFELELSKLEREYKNNFSLIGSIQQDADKTKTKISDNEILLDVLRGKYISENEKEFVFVQESASCPTCKQSLPLEVVDAELLKANFNKEKVSKLKSITDEAEEVQNELKKLRESLLGHLSKKEDLLFEQNAVEIKIEQLKANAPKPGNVDLSAIDPIKQEIEVLKSQLNIVPDSTFDALRLDNQKLTLAQIRIDIVQLQKELSKYEVLESLEARQTELLKRENEILSLLSEYEKQEFYIQEFNSLKIKSVESRINSMFEFVSFKMFNTLINGSVEETCETLIKGVPFPDVNTAGKINAGLDIINVLSNYYGVSAPCFIDGAESICNYIPTNNQLIKLIVDGTKNGLVIE